MHNGAPFYMTVASDAAMDLFGSNSASSLATKLKSISHTGRWEVALVEPQYHNSMQTLHTDEEIIISCVTTTIRKTPDEINVGRQDFLRISIPLENCADKQLLLKFINEKLPQMSCYSVERSAGRLWKSVLAVITRQLEFVSDVDQKIKAT